MPAGVSREQAAILDDYVEERYAPKTIKRIAHAGQIPLDDKTFAELETGLKSLAWWYRYGETIAKTRRRNVANDISEAIKQLKRVEKRTKALTETLEGLTDHACLALRSLPLPYVLSEWSFRDERPAIPVTQELWFLASRARWATRDLQFLKGENGLRTGKRTKGRHEPRKSARGRPPNTTRRSAVYQLAYLFKRLAKRRPGRWVRSAVYNDDVGREYGPFRDFVIAALEPIEGDDAKVGINDLIREVSERWENIEPEITA